MIITNEIFSSTVLFLKFKVNPPLFLHTNPYYTILYIKQK
nr:MAG TPA_asm: hypothetical protein [Caudoviricetes sp.]